MEVVTIPQAFDELQNLPIVVVDYRTSNPCQKQKVNLSQSTIAKASIVAYYSRPEK